MNKTAVILASDLHSNSTVGLAPKSVNLDDGGTYRASRAQRWMHDCWLDFGDKVKRIEADQKILVLNGDIGELDTKRRSTQLISLNKATVQNIMLDVVEPLVDLVDKVVVTRGTMAHVGKSGWLEEWLAGDLDNALHDKNSASWWHFRGEISAVKFDVTHHAGMGRLPWTEKNSANKVAATMQYYYAVEMRQPPPDVAVRSHNHRYATSGDNYPTEVVFLPCWSLITEFGYRIGAENNTPDIGGMVYVCDGGSYTRQKIVYGLPEVRRIWQLKI